MWKILYGRKLNNVLFFGFNYKMRLSGEYKNIIVSVIYKYISYSKIFLFGSRVDDTKKGGDIDVFVQTDQNVSLADQVKILAEIELKGVLRKVDLVVETEQFKKEEMYKTIQKDGILLC